MGEALDHGVSKQRAPAMLCEGHTGTRWRDHGTPLQGKSKQLMVASRAAGAAKLVLVDPRSPKEVQKLYATPGRITGLDVSRDGSLFA